MRQIFLFSFVFKLSRVGCFRPFRALSQWIGIFPVAIFMKASKKRAEEKKEGWRYYNLGLL